MNIQEFKSLFVDRNAGQNYLDIVKTNQERILNREEGYELHHIIPRSFGGTNARENFVKLSVKDHITAHYLLAKATEDRRALAAFSFMVNVQGRNLMSEQEFQEQLPHWEEIRKKGLQANKGLRRTEEQRRNISEGHKGKHLSEAARKRHSEALKGRPKSKEHIDKIRESKKNFSEEKKARIAEKIREARKGFRHTEETKSQMSQSHKGVELSMQHRQSISNALRGNPKILEAAKRRGEQRRGQVGPTAGRVYVSKGTERLLIPLDQVLFYESLGYERRRSKISEQARQNMSRAHKGKESRWKGSAWMLDMEGNFHRVLKQDIETRTQEGWIQKARKIKIHDNSLSIKDE